ncbi:hypothetical protein KIPB_000348, partial [Kipferlia bialata]|eukprot:g348.t1
MPRQAERRERPERSRLSRASEADVTGSSDDYSYTDETDETRTHDASDRDIVRTMPGPQLSFSAFAANLKSNPSCTFSPASLPSGINLHLWMGAKQNPHAIVTHESQWGPALPGAVRVFPEPGVFATPEDCARLFAPEEAHMATRASRRFNAHGLVEDVFKLVLSYVDAKEETPLSIGPFDLPPSALDFIGTASPLGLAPPPYDPEAPSAMWVQSQCAQLARNVQALQKAVAVMAPRHPAAKPSSAVRMLDVLESVPFAVYSAVEAGVLIAVPPLTPPRGVDVMALALDTVTGAIESGLSAAGAFSGPTLDATQFGNEATGS